MKELFFNTIQEFNDYIGVKTLHPLVSIARVENTSPIQEAVHHYGLYALFLKENKGCTMIKQELQHPIDRHSRELIVSNIELLLNYYLRFYDRQFITREEINHSVVKKFIFLLDEYIARKAEREGLPTVAYFADKCCYSTKYFGELVKTETGRTAKSLISDRLLSAARQLLVDETLTITQVSQRLGFEYSQHFVRFFKAQTGKTPSEYRKTA